LEFIFEKFLESVRKTMETPGAFSKVKRGEVEIKKLFKSKSETLKILILETCF
jgi:hypothetical protein